MKTTIIFLGLAVLNFTNGKAANELNTQDLVQQDLTTVIVENAQQSQLVLVNKGISKITFENTGEEAVIFNPNTVIKSTYTKAIDQVIAENKLVVDSEEEIFQPIVLEMSVEDKISESNQIIESKLDKEVYPLDFEKINRTLKSNKPNNNNMAVPVDLKL